jgi:hypothetical protein
MHTEFQLETEEVRGNFETRSTNKKIILKLVFKKGRLLTELLWLNEALFMTQ